ncbi:hypothetical protein AVEN_269788-1 [Araneus ventricosus]|uniref:Uncharacterized protein n=1 Tax=Araneus ventricosus TaxID=182803 RepID=A0A4Y2PB13_ARAVE|nr:hypothetical protein AVEN_269788-1 [Araneus ventricosus]
MDTRHPSQLAAVQHHKTGAGTFCPSGHCRYPIHLLFTKGLLGSPWLGVKWYHPGDLERERNQGTGRKLRVELPELAWLPSLKVGSWRGANELTMLHGVKNTHPFRWAT